MATSRDQASTIKKFIETCATRWQGVNRVILFGSRARGDARERSDFDLAVEAPGITHQDWSRFAAEFQEEFPSLCKVDLVLLNDKTPQALRDKILQDGKVLYDQAA